MFIDAVPLSTFQQHRKMEDFLTDLINGRFFHIIIRVSLKYKVNIMNIDGETMTR